jgi:hypothetical protein
MQVVGSSRAMFTFAIFMSNILGRCRCFRSTSIHFSSAYIDSLWQELVLVYFYFLKKIFLTSLLCQLEWTDTSWRPHLELVF